jgi:hypothetical protein
LDLSSSFQEIHKVQRGTFRGKDYPALISHLIHLHNARKAAPAIAKLNPPFIKQRRTIILFLEIEVKVTFEMFID